MPEKISVPPRDELVTLKQTQTYTEIADHYGASPSTVSRWMKHYGLTNHQPTLAPTKSKPRNAGGLDGYRHRLNEQDRKTIRRWYDRMIAHKRRRDRARQTVERFQAMNPDIELIFAGYYDIDPDEYELEEL